MIEIQKSIKDAKKKVIDTEVQCEDIKKFILKVPNWREEFQNADTQTKQMLLATIIDRIEVCSEEIHISFKISLDDYIDDVAFESSIYDQTSESIVFDNGLEKPENRGDNLLLETSDIGTTQCKHGSM